MPFQTCDIVLPAPVKVLMTAGEASLILIVHAAAIGSVAEMVVVSSSPSLFGENGLGAIDTLEYMLSVENVTGVEYAELPKVQVAFALALRSPFARAD